MTPGASPGHRRVLRLPRRGGPSRRRRDRARDAHFTDVDLRLSSLQLREVRMTTCLDAPCVLRGVVHAFTGIPLTRHEPRRPQIPPRRRARHARDHAAPRRRSGAPCSTPGATPPRRPSGALAHWQRDRAGRGAYTAYRAAQDREDAAQDALDSDPDVADQRLVAAVGRGRLGARLAALVGALREDQPARPDVPAPRCARRPRRAPCCGRGRRGRGAGAPRTAAGA